MLKTKTFEIIFSEDIDEKTFNVEAQMVIDGKIQWWKNAVSVIRPDYDVALERNHFIVDSLKALRVKFESDFLTPVIDKLKN